MYRLCSLPFWGGLRTIWSKRRSQSLPTALSCWPSIGVLATVAAGMLMGNLALLSFRTSHNDGSTGRDFVIAFWDFAAFVANSVVFLLIGMTVAHVSFPELGFAALAITILLVLTGRALTVYLLCLVFIRTRWAIPITAQHVMWWGGLRGALTLALALPASLPLRNKIVTAAFGVVAFSIVTQGLTMSRLFRMFGLISERR